MVGENAAHFLVSLCLFSNLDARKKYKMWSSQFSSPAYGSWNMPMWQTRQQPSFNVSTYVCFLFGIFVVIISVFIGNTRELDLFFYLFQLAGGTASMQQLKERLEKDLLEVYLLMIRNLRALEWKGEEDRSKTKSLSLSWTCRSLLKLLGLKYWQAVMQQKEDSGMSTLILFLMVISHGTFFTYSIYNV